MPHGIGAALKGPSYEEMRYLDEDLLLIMDRFDDYFY
jgi:hypothetical protein